MLLFPPSHLEVKPKVKNNRRSTTLSGVYACVCVCGRKQQKQTVFGVREVEIRQNTSASNVFIAGNGSITRIENKEATTVTGALAHDAIERKNNIEKEKN